MSKTVCTWVELNKSGVNELLKDTAQVVEEVARQVAATSGEGATAKMGTRYKRPVALVVQPYEEASKNNNLIKSVFGRKK